MYYCTECKKYHRESSIIGKKHKKYDCFKQCDKCGKYMPQSLVMCWYCGNIIDDNLLELLKNTSMITLNLTNLQKKIIKEIKKSKRISTSQLIKRIKCSKRGTLASLRSLEKKKLIKSKKGKKEMIWSCRR